ncbi:MAG: Txe/YoeB family addiction module toxin [Cyclobacteriaceae bacterium]|nr:Txe/YoeB family addiction module toxin [Cyclobacteriaceae bacterium]
MRHIVFTETALSELNSFKFGEVRLAFKVLELIEDINKQPFTGIGKPEPLKGDFAGFWSRRINDKHRLIYSVSDEAIQIISCKGHYD